jgi:tetratricopeptide (TPR) repeat protein
MAVAATQTAADAVRSGAMIRRHGLSMRLVAGLLVGGGALLGIGSTLGAQTLAREAPLVIIPMSSKSELLTSPPPDILISEGNALYDAGRYKEAAASFERAMQAGVARPHEAAWSVARSYAKLGNRKQALRWAEIATLLEHPERANRPLRISLLLKI